MGSVAKRVFREPLVHFLVIAVLIFAVDQAARSDADDPRVIVVDDAVRSELIALFEEGQGRPPTGAEVEALIDRWLYNEIMYREAVALGLDQGDEMFRSRLELKLRAMLIESASVDPPTEEQLRAWFEENRERYRVPRRFDVAQFRVDGEGEEAEQAALRLSGTLVDGVIPEPYDDRLRVYRNRSRENIAAVFGEPFAAGLLDGGGPAGGEHGSWRPVRSIAGWHVARIEAAREPVEPAFEVLRPQLEAEWLKAQNKRAAAEAFREIRDSYTIRREDAR